ncbi:MAG: 50S ribosomal protein L17 [bacterium]|nr:50S ribosomal protein L17 [bacterium]
MKNQPLKNLALPLIRYGHMETTLARAKATGRFMDRLVAQAKKGTLESRRRVLAALGNNNLANKLVDEIAINLNDRPSGFTRIIKLGRRKGDGAAKARIEFVKWQETTRVVPKEKTITTKEVKKSPKKIIKKKAK